MSHKEHARQIFIALLTDVATSSGVYGIALQKKLHLIQFSFHFFPLYKKPIFDSIYNAKLKILQTVPKTFLKFYVLFYLNQNKLIERTFFCKNKIYWYEFLFECSFSNHNISLWNQIIPLKQWPKKLDKHKCSILCDFLELFQV